MKRLGILLSIILVGCAESTTTVVRNCTASETDNVVTVSCPNNVSYEIQPQVITIAEPEITVIQNNEFEYTCKRGGRHE